ncbi:MAG: nucleotidyl transferase AbiEii/AbiGii toxin family protein, partial [Chloroflexota bacterium]|nr:nucleotidyl transferase AbiEii/AbiGii toxin family protein [Chloroflexota bacterium]
MGGNLVRISAERLVAAAEATGFRADMLERVAQLLGLLEAIQRHPFLRGKLALKGGTALNLFVFDVPRLSVDIDLNYVGAAGREAMLAERPQLEEALGAVFAREELSSRQITAEHAGGKWVLRYLASSGQTGRIDVDINYMYRVPLWPVIVTDSRRVGGWQATGVPVIDVP